MYVAPDTNLRFIRNCPLAQNLDQTILFDSREAQTAYFTGIAEYTRDKYSFQRRQPGVIRVDLPYESCIYFNYMCYQNHAHANKWFYAFVTGCEYINEGCTAIYFTLDVLQTWMFDWELGSCFVERETTPTDEPGDYLLEEGLNTGDFISDTPQSWRAVTHWLIASTVDLTKQDFPNLENPVKFYSRQCCEYNLFAGTATTGITSVLKPLTEAGKTSAVKYLYPAVGQCLILAGMPDEINTVVGQQVAYDSPTTARPTAFDGYTPKNKKLLCYPYSFLTAVSTEGQIAQYRYEWFTDPDNIKFKVETALTPQSYVTMSPADYFGKTINRELASTLPPLPLGGFNYEVYSTWFALNKNSIQNRELWDTVNMVREIGSGATQGAMGVAQTAARESALVGAGASPLTAVNLSAAGYIGAGLVALGSVANASLSLLEKSTTRLAAYRDMQAMPNETALQSGTIDVQLATDNYGWDLRKMHMRPENLKSLDDYFSRFGYKVMVTETPTLKNRPVWDYIKTLDTDIAGQVPLADLEEIKAKFERGITFWHNAATFGDYSQDNSPS